MPDEIKRPLLAVIDYKRQDLPDKLKLIFKGEPALILLKNSQRNKELEEILRGRDISFDRVKDIDSVTKEFFEGRYEKSLVIYLGDETEQKAKETIKDISEKVYNYVKEYEV